MRFVDAQGHVNEICCVSVLPKSYITAPKHANHIQFSRKASKKTITMKLTYIFYIFLGIMLILSVVDAQRPGSSRSPASRTPRTRKPTRVWPKRTRRTRPTKTGRPSAAPVTSKPALG
uniref:Uncharacterized protein n=1 Tax=Anopheles merus TaxID=30066 RepID=A0A182V262_ANOME